MTAHDSGLICVIDGHKVTLTAEQLAQAISTGRLPSERPAPTTPAVTVSPSRDQLMTDLEQRGFAREVPFRGQSGRRRFAFDAAHERARVAVDYHGFGKGGAHNFKSKRAGDADKLNEAQLCGWLYIVCDAISVQSGRCLEHVDAALARRDAA